MSPSPVEGTSSVTNAKLRIYLLGEPYLVDVERDSEIRLPARCSALLAFLLLNRKTRSRESIAAALWPDTGEFEARANLRRTLHVLSHALPPGARSCLKADARSLQWNALAPVWCDVEAFERLGRAENTRGEAVDLYGGDLLSGDDAEWIVERRVHLRERHCALLEAIAETKLRCGDTGGASHSLRRLLAIDPFREDAFRSLFVLRSTNGDRAGATSEYRAFVRRLQSELGVEPMPETVACYDSAFV